jgi:hypothetical protein
MNPTETARESDLKKAHQQEQTSLKVRGAMERPLREIVPGFPYESVLAARASPRIWS